MNTHHLGIVEQRRRSLVDEQRQLGPHYTRFHRTNYTGCYRQRHSSLGICSKIATILSELRNLGYPARPVARLEGRAWAFVRRRFRADNQGGYFSTLAKGAST